jgi:hypothetical protein
VSAVAETLAVFSGLEALAATGAVVYVVNRLGPKPRGAATPPKPLDDDLMQEAVARAMAAKPVADAGHRVIDGQQQGGQP